MDYELFGTCLLACVVAHCLVGVVAWHIYSTFIDVIKKTKERTKNKE